MNKVKPHHKVKNPQRVSHSRKIIIFFGFVILLLVISLFFQRDRMNEEMALKIEFIEQKNMLRDELDDLIDEHDGLLDEYGYLNEQMYRKDSIIQQQISEIRSLIRTKNDLKEAKKKIVALQEIARRYLNNIDSLVLINEKLTMVKDSVIKVNQNINLKNYKLNKENETLSERLNKGAMLKVVDFEIKTVKQRSLFGEFKTSRAKNVDNMKVCFTIAANSLSEPGVKSVYMQLISPSGSVIESLDKINILLGDSVSSMTVQEKFEYVNNETTNCFEWKTEEVILDSGTYMINLIIEGRIAAQQELNLK